MGDLLGVDLRHKFSAEAEQVEARRHRDKRNPYHQARRWIDHVAHLHDITNTIMNDFDVSV